MPQPTSTGAPSAVATATARSAVPAGSPYGTSSACRRMASGSARSSAQTASVGTGPCPVPPSRTRSRSSAAGIAYARSSRPAGSPDADPGADRSQMPAGISSATAPGSGEATADRAASSQAGAGIREPRSS
ncbi:hypothetical protein OHA72_37110 [Dactylosporangium sp. NBC_01737]|uniref:hypothetical protein n=1 Tax=Dactylosporangium sp. NBC_01737 TaxID=2975959 RepID=UPI002E105313|nr:hypothetical protein OHA72_37110 [Dactylosporangium sp. NBC_01737]